MCFSFMSQDLTTVKRWTQMECGQKPPSRRSFRRWYDGMMDGFGKKGWISQGKEPQPITSVAAAFVRSSGTHIEHT
jgi:hypothetical protein